jgi:hypothetical protein
MRRLRPQLLRFELPRHYQFINTQVSQIQARFSGTYQLSSGRNLKEEKHSLHTDGSVAARPSHSNNRRPLSSTVAWSESHCRGIDAGFDSGIVLSC